MTDGLAAAPETRLVDEARRRSALRLSGRDQLVTLGSALGFLGTAFLLRGVLGGGPLPSPIVLGLLVLSYAVLSRAEFELGSGTVVPTELVLVPMLFLLPPADVPLVVAVSFVLGLVPDVVRGRVHLQRAIVRISYSWHAVGPAIVFGVFQPGPPSWDDWPVYLLALGSQFAFDLASSMGRECLGIGIAPSVVAPVLLQAWLADLLLAPIGFLAAYATVGGSLGFLPVLSLGVLLALLATDRRERIDETIVLTDAFETASTAARIDPLTGLANRLAWKEGLAQASLDHRDGRPVSIILLDLDRLKLANDALGHAFGDRLIQFAGELVSSCIGGEGLVARIGGDEFAVLLPGTDGPSCQHVLARLVSAVERSPDLDGFELSFSVGAASAPPGESLEAAFDLADLRMYRRKRERHRRDLSATADDRELVTLGQGGM